MRTHRRRSLVVPLVLLSLLVPEVPASATPAGTPRIQLRAASSSVELLRYGAGEPVWLDVGVHLASLGAPFDLRVRRESYDDPLRIWQAFHRPDGLGLEELPSDVLDGWLGLTGFLRIQLFAQDGTLVRHRVSTVCPAGWDAQRVDDSGPFDPTYPTGCYANDFSLGAVWGIDQGWALAPIWMSDLSVRVPDGRYRAAVSISPRYRELFAVADEDAVVQVDVRIRTRNGCTYCEGAAPDLHEARSASTPAASTTSPDPDTTPDLVALPAFGIGIRRQSGRDYLSFGADVWNRGPASLVVEGFRAEGEDRMDAYQYFLRDGVVVGRASVGSFVFDRRDGHRHWHFRQFARYRLFDGSLATVVRSRKQSFCLAPTDAIDLTVEGAVWRTDGLGFSRCGWDTALWIREVLPTGWGDTYYQGVPGQSFDITDLPNGSYWIEVRANPLGALFDGDPTNDAELRGVILGGTPGARTVSVPPWHGIDTG